MQTSAIGPRGTAAIGAWRKLNGGAGRPESGLSEGPLRGRTLPFDPGTKADAATKSANDRFADTGQCRLSTPQLKLGESIFGHRLGVRIICA
jgi:hypothetical protein